MFIITGGGSGIGKALAQALATKKKPVLIVGRRQQPLAEVAAFSPLIQICVADITTTTGRQALVHQVASQPQIEGLVHNAGLLTPMTPLATISSQDWQAFLDTHLNAPLFLTQALLPQLSQGRVLHIGTGAASFPVKNWGGYCVSKAALSMLTRCLQLESETTAFSSVKPGIVDTAMQALARESTALDPQKRDFFIQLYREKRLVSPTTVADFLTWLLIDLNRDDFVRQEWDIYDKNHHVYWLKPTDRPPALD